MLLNEYIEIYKCDVFHWAHAKTRITLTLKDTLQKLQEYDVQILYVNTDEVTHNECFSELCALIKKNTIWAINAGEASFSPYQCTYLIDVIKNSNVAFMFIDAILVGKDTVREFKDIIRERRRNTITSRWLISDNEAQNNVILRCRNMWFGPCSLGRNKKMLQQMKG